MKKLFLLAALIVAVNLTTFAQSLVVSPTTVESGGLITLTGTGESSASRIQNIQYDSFNTTTSSPSTNYQVYITVTDGTLTQSFNPGLGTPIPTKYTFKVANLYSSPITVNIGFTVWLSGGSQASRNVTVTVNPVPPQTVTYHNVAKSGTFIKNNCGAGTAGSSVTYSVAAGVYSGATQAEADSKAQNDINANGQNYANANGQCLTLYYNSEISGSFTRNNCSDYGGPGPAVIYSVPAGKYSATSQSAADNLALNDLNTNGQAYANANGSCAVAFSIQLLTPDGANNDGTYMVGTTITARIYFPPNTPALPTGTQVEFRLDKPDGTEIRTWGPGSNMAKFNLDEATQYAIYARTITNGVISPWSYKFIIASH